MIPLPPISSVVALPRREQQEVQHNVERRRSALLALAGGALFAAILPPKAQASFITYADKLNYVLSSAAARRSILARLSERPSVLDFNENAGTGGDDTAALVDLTTYVNNKGGGPAYLPAGNSTYGSRTYRFNQNLVPVAPIQYIGDGMGFPAFISQPASLITKLLWTGGNDNMFRYVSVNWGGGISNMLVDCAGTAYGALLLDSTTGFRMQQVRIVSHHDIAINCVASFNTCSWNDFDQIAVENQLNNTTAIAFDLALGAGGNCAHMTFNQTRIYHAGTGRGILLGGCDNLCFTGTTIFADPGTTGPDVQVDPTVQATFPSECLFNHLEATGPGWVHSAATVVSPAIIWGYNQSPAPTLLGIQPTWFPTNGNLDIPSNYSVQGKTVVGSRKAAVANATGSGDVVAQLNTLLSRLRAHGLIEP